MHVCVCVLGEAKISSTIAVVDLEIEGGGLGNGAHKHVQKCWGPRPLLVTRVHSAPQFDYEQDSEILVCS